MLSEALKKLHLPPSPGSYQFINEAGGIIYVGKAKNLARRVASYRRADDPKTLHMLREVAQVQFTVTRDEVEALLLEAKLIRSHQPKYNVSLKGGERYAYLEVTAERYPRLVTTRTPSKSARVFGPYTSGETRNHARHLANSMFKLRVCRKLPQRACLLYHLKLCSAPCIGKITPEEYQRNVTKAEQLLRGEVEPLRTSLQREMRQYAARQEYEQAKVRRDQLCTLERMGTDQAAKLRHPSEQDAVNFAATPSTMIVQLFHASRGVISRRREFTLRRTRGQSDPELLAEFLTQYYYREDIPQEVIIPLRLPDQGAVAAYLAQASGRPVEITVPKFGEKRRLLELLAENLAVSSRAGDGALLQLQEHLRLPSLPRVIECVDISNLGPTNVVGSLVRFRDGQPDKDGYRRFRIKTFRGQSDYAAMREVIERHFRRLLGDRAPLPDLLLVDGGKPQLGAALSVFRQFGMTLPVAALAKRFEELYTTDAMHPLRLPPTSAALKLVQRVRNEAHRFALKYQTLLRGKDFAAPARGS